MIVFVGWTTHCVGLGYIPCDSVGSHIFVGWTTHCVGLGYIHMYLVWTLIVVFPCGTYHLWIVLHSEQYVMGLSQGMSVDIPWVCPHSHTSASDHPSVTIHRFITMKCALTRSHSAHLAVVGSSQMLTWRLT